MLLWKNGRIFLSLALIILVVLVGCSNGMELVELNIDTEKSNGQIYLYGERHGVKTILDKELELWDVYYNEDKMRHLFVESSYYGAEFLNIWMKSDNDQILEEIYEDLKGTQSYNPDVKDFYKKIKTNYPETIFHGTDLGHQYNTTGKRFLEYLENNNLEDTDDYVLSKEAIEQGKLFYDKLDHGYRETKMTENFIREFDKLKSENIMGIYGGAHTDFKAMDYNTNSVPSMANHLKKRYGDSIHIEDLSDLVDEIEPVSIDSITVNEKEYEASYFGIQSLAGFKDYDYREFWRLENSYEDFKDYKKNGDVLPYNNYPMKIEIGQVFVMDMTKKDGTVIRYFYRSDGLIWQGKDSTEAFIVK